MTARGVQCRELGWESRFSQDDLYLHNWQRFISHSLFLSVVPIKNDPGLKLPSHSRVAHPPRICGFTITLPRRVAYFSHLCILFPLPLSHRLVVRESTPLRIICGWVSACVLLCPFSLTPPLPHLTLVKYIYHVSMDTGFNLYPEWLSPHPTI